VQIHLLPTARFLQDTELHIATAPRILRALADFEDLHENTVCYPLLNQKLRERKKKKREKMGKFKLELIKHNYGDEK
jgi:hypothetical protein